MAEQGKGMGEILSRHGFRFNKGLGQNFLTDPTIPERMAERSRIDGTMGVLEIGPGMGVLTKPLAERAAAVVSVELDSRLLPVLRETLQGIENVRVIGGDIMKEDLGALVAENFQGLTPVACANLPYNITTPVLEKLFESRLFGQITVMVQKEVAERITAPPGTKTYGAFTVYANWMAQPEILFSVPAGCFYPRPKVDSAVVLFKMREKPPEPVDEALFFRVVRAAFGQRRKTLLNALHARFGGTLSKDALAETLAAAGISPMVRGEMLDIRAFAQITEKLCEKIG
ncbi:16S rRNA (adenine(1518)-N(6)/adenine(1519)-N(6))-dimethyltransferase RsmA [Oscillospiraceae bacterium OttesenSCG-928-F05]|nr:16S rRNA (adenine(1518)-N(6)/adenine(1519)-N(6))-dimethyltransferase RsmA [Oscillospiraceae bacterium OttesenSCG-928-F05]